MDTTIDKTEVALKKAKKVLKKFFVPGAKFERINYLYKSQVPIGKPVIVTVDRICQDSIAFLVSTELGGNEIKNTTTYETLPLLVSTELGGNETSYLAWPIAKGAELKYSVSEDEVHIFSLTGKLNLSYKRI